jgi:enoyl-CoA hydratase/carnithine racemase
MAYDTIIYDKPEDGVARITLNRPEARNAMSYKLMEELFDAADDAAEDDSIAVLIYRGNGPSFCAGRDFKDGAARKQETGVSSSVFGESGLGHATWLHPKCTIAQVQGYALGGGDLLAASCDITIASEDARFGFPEARWGATAGGYGGWFWNWIIGPKKTKQYMFSGRHITADEAYHIGLINEVVSLDDLEGTVTSLAHDIAQLNRSYPGIIQADKIMINSQHPELAKFFDPRNVKNFTYLAEYAANAASRAEFDDLVAKEGVRAGIANMHKGYSSTG